MKHVFLILAMILTAVAAAAQDNWFFPAQGKVNGYTTTITSIAGSQTMYSKIRSTADSNGITVTSEVFAAADAATPVQTTSVKYKDNGDAYVVDFKDALSSSLGSVENIDITESSGEMTYPKNPENGKTYGTVDIKMAADIMGTSINLGASIKDRAVTAAETVEVPAGKFDCLKFEETVEVEMMGQPVQTKTTSWIAHGVGVVKQTTDSMNGMVTATMELSAIEE